MAWGGGPRGPGQLALLLWTVAVCVASQVPYQLVWRGLSTFPYDAFTTFNPWLVGQLNELRAGEGVLALYQDEVPFDIWPSYFFSGILRQLLVFLQANTAIGHAIVQAIHIVLMVPAVGLLCRSFGVPWKYGVIGGLAFTLMGIHVSVTQHVLADEALLYLVLSAYCVRELIFGWHSSEGAQRALLFGATGILTISLVRVHHEAILYLIPLATWAAGHLIALKTRTQDGKVVLRTAGMMAGLAALVGIASAPMLVTAYELSLINKTVIDSYAQLGPYFSDMRVFFISLVLPGFSGANAPGLPLPFDFRQEATLSYVFLGSLTLPLLGVVLRTWWGDGRKTSAAILLAAFVVLAGYTLGAGSPIHRLLCLVFPFLVNIGHNYYGLHVMYLLAAFVVAEGLWIVVRRERYLLLAGMAMLQGVLVSYAAYRALAGSGWGLRGSFEAFADAVIRDLHWQLVVLAVLVLLALLTFARPHGETVARRIRSRIGAGPFQTIALILLAVLVGGDMLRPVLSANFVPKETWISWAVGPLGGFNPSRDVRRFIEAEQAASQRPLRVVPIFPKGGGWQGNGLMVTEAHLVGMPGDTGGNRYVESWLSRPPSPKLVTEFVDRLGVDIVWVSRWGVDDWHRALEATTTLRKVYSSPYGGDVYIPRKDGVAAVEARHGILEIPWTYTDDQVTVKKGPVTRIWRFSLPVPKTESQVSRQVELPLMWHAGYGVELSDGTPVTWQPSVDGRLLATLPYVPADEQVELVVRYPNQLLSAAVVLAAIIYVGLLALLILAGVALMRKKRKT